MKKNLLILVLTSIFLTNSFAQQTIVNVPSADVLDKGKVYVEFDASYKFNSKSANTVNEFSSFVPRIVVGIGNKIEVGMNLIGNIQPGADATTIVPTIKAKVYEKESWAIVTGANIYLPVRNRAYNIGSYTYVQASKALKSNTRITVGATTPAKMSLLQVLSVQEDNSVSNKQSIQNSVLEQTGSRANTPPAISHRFLPINHIQKSQFIKAIQSAMQMRAVEIIFSIPQSVSILTSFLSPEKKILP